MEGLPLSRWRWKFGSLQGASTLRARFEPLCLFARRHRIVLLRG